MDSRNGDLYPTKEAALLAGVPERDMVEVQGTRRAVRRLSGRVRMASQLLARRRKAKRQQQKASRRRNSR